MTLSSLETFLFGSLCLLGSCLIFMNIICKMSFKHDLNLVKRISISYTNNNFRHKKKRKRKIYYCENILA